MNLESLSVRGSTLWKAANSHINQLFGKTASDQSAAIGSARIIIFAYTIGLLALPAFLSYPVAWLISVSFMLYLSIAAAVNFVCSDGTGGEKDFAFCGFAMFTCLILPLPFINIRVLSFLSVVGLSSAYVSFRTECKSFDVNDTDSFKKAANSIQFDNFVSAGKAIILGADFAAS